MLLHCCTQCKEEISRRQIEDAEWFVEKQKPLDFDAEFVKLDEELVRCRGNICKDMDRVGNKLRLVLIKKYHLFENNITRDNLLDVINNDADFTINGN